MTVRAMLESMTASEFAQWRAFDALDPIGDVRADHHAALIAQQVAAGPQEGTHRFGDYVLKWEPEPMDEEARSRALMAIVIGAAGGHVVKKGQTNGD